MTSALWGDRPASCLSATLHHLTLATPDPGALGRFYEAGMGYRLKAMGDGVAALAPGRRLLFVHGDPKRLESAGFALADEEELARLRERLQAHGCPRRDGPTPFFRDATIVEDPDGTRIVLGLPIDAPEDVTSDAPPARLQHVVTASRDPARIVAFFETILGFTVSDNVVDGEGGLRAAFLRCSGEHHSFAVFKAAENRLDHHCYETGDWYGIRDWSDRMAAQHIRLQWGPGRHGPGNNLFIFVHDPDGNWLEISAELEIVDHDRAVGTWAHGERTLNSWGQGKLRS